jgi:hypothetical protein
MSVSPHLGAQTALPPSSSRSLFLPDMLHDTSTILPSPIDRFVSNTTGGCSSQYLQQAVSSSSSYPIAFNSQASSSTSSSSPILPLPPTTSSSSISQSTLPRPSAPPTSYFDPFGSAADLQAEYLEFAVVDSAFDWFPSADPSRSTDLTAVNRDFDLEIPLSLANGEGPGFGDGFLGGLPGNPDDLAAPAAAVITTTGRRQQTGSETAPTPADSFPRQAAPGASDFQFDDASQFTSASEGRNFASGGDVDHHHHHPPQSGSNSCRTSRLPAIQQNDITHTAENIITLDDSSPLAPATVNLHNLEISPEPSLPARDAAFSSTIFSDSHPSPPRPPRLGPFVFPRLPPLHQATGTDTMPVGRRSGRRTPAAGPSNTPVVISSSGGSPLSSSRTSRKRDSGVAGLDDTDTPTKKRKTKKATVDKLDADRLFDEFDSDEDVIDLRGDTIPDFATEEKKQRGEMIMVSRFQCAICMDYAAGLTVTHCGELTRAFAMLTGQVKTNAG